MPEQNYIITTDSNTELPLSIAREYNVTYVPMDYLLDGTEYFYDLGEKTDFKAFFDAVRNGKLPTTSTYPPQYYVDLWRPMLESGKDVLHLGFSSKLSAAYSYLCDARDILNCEAGRRVATVDLRSISGGAAVLVYNALQQYRAGKTLDEVAAWVENNTVKAQHWFTVNDLNHLRRGGRVSAAQALLGSLMKIKPVMHVDDEGRLIPMEKVMGRKKALQAIVDKTAERYDGSVKAVFISHGDVLDEAHAVERMIKEKLPGVDVLIHMVGPVIGAHSGPGTMAIFCFGSPR